MSDNSSNHLLADLRHVVLDLDGTLYLDERLFPSSLPFLAQLQRSGIGYTFITNNNARSRREYLAFLRRVGIDAPEEALFTSAHATIAYLREHLPGVSRPYILGAAGLIEELAAAGLNHHSKDPDGVIVGFALGLEYQQLAEAAYWISRGLPYVATHPDRVCPTSQPLVLPDCGAICSLLEAATGRRPDAVPGKPDPAMLTGLLQTHGVEPHQAAMVGDRLYTDMKMAHSAGVVGVLTLTGETTRADLAEADLAPALVVEDLADLGRRIAMARGV